MKISRKERVTINLRLSLAEFSILEQALWHHDDDLDSKYPDDYRADFSEFYSKFVKGSRK